MSETEQIAAGSTAPAAEPEAAPQALRILLVDDSEGDAILISRALRRGGFDVAYTRVASAGEMRQALDGQPWDAVISDHRMPNFDVFGALEIHRSGRPDIPFLIVSGAIGEETAVAAMKAGAHDYIVKDNLARLPIAMQRELAASAARRERDHMEQALRRSEEQFRKVFEESPNGNVLASQDYRLIRVNAALCRMLGYSENELVRMSFRDITHPEHIERDTRHVAMLWAGQIPVYKTEKRYLRKDGTAIWASTAVSLIRDEHDKPMYALSMIEDITESKRAEEDLHKAVARLEELDRARQEFVSNVSHEMKTPLASILFATRNLLKGVSGPVPKEVAHYIRMMDGEARRLLNTVSDILDMRQLESDQFRLVRIRLPIARVVTRRCDAIRMQAQEKKLHVTLAVDRKAGFVDCDPERMERVVTNILANAVKFTPAGGEIRVTVRRDAQAPDQVLLSVTDTGIGIPPEALPRIAERYFRVGNHPLGTGIGLAISKEIVKRHGGELTVISPPPDRNQGTQVAIRLPVSPPPVILIVDMESSVRQAIERQLSGYGFVVARLEEASDDLETAADLRPDCVVVNVADGCDWALRVKCHEGFQDTAMVAVAADALDDTRRRVLDELGIRTLLRPKEPDAIVDGVEEELLGKAFFRSQAPAPHGEEVAP